MQSKVKYFSENTVGRDFCVGDLHGQYEIFLAALKAIQFDETKDRMFSVGDLVDRGEDSISCLRLVKKPWFHATLGNHDLFFLAAAAPNLVIEEFQDDIPSMIASWFMNGGKWFLNEPDAIEYVKDVIPIVADLPFINVVETKYGRRNILHAEPKRMRTEAGEPEDDSLLKISDADIDSENFNTEAAIWGRERISAALENLFIEDTSATLSPTFVGHKVVGNPAKIGNIHYIDLGCFATKNLAITELSSEKLDTFIISGE